jgi:HEAT repeat protein
VLLLLGVAVLAFAGAQSQPRKASVDGLVYDLKHPDPDRRAEAARLLGANKLNQAVPALMEAAGDSQPAVRLAVLEALAKIHDPRALPTFITLTGDSEADIRRKAIAALIEVYVVDASGFVAGTMKVIDFLNPFDSDYNTLVVEPYVPVSAEAVQALAQRLEDPETGVRKAAVMGLGTLRGRAALPQMKDVLSREPENGIKIEYFRSFYKIGDPDACGRLVPYVNDPDKAVHDEAILTSGLLRCKESVDAIMDIYQMGIKEREKVFGVIPASSADDLQIKCLQSLALIGDARAAKLYLPALRHDKEDFRVAAAEGLARLADAQHEPVLTERSAGAKGKRFQLALAYAFYRLGHKERLAELVRELGGSSHGDQVYAYLVELTPDQLADLYPHLRASKGKTRIRLLEAMGVAGSPHNLSEVQSYTNDSDADVASAALVAVRRIQARHGI